MWIILSLALGSPPPWTPSPDEAALLQVLSLRDGTPSCGELVSMVPDPTTSLLHIVDNVTMPPWAPMRAAICLIDKKEAEIEPQLREWVTQPQKLGLAKLVLRRAHTLNPTRAKTLSELSLTSENRDTARQILSVSPDPILRQLVKQ